MFSTNSTLADEISATGERPRRDRSNEPNEIERQQRFDRGVCRDCPRKRRLTGKLCTWCRRRIEANTVRDAGKQPRKGRLSIEDMDKADATQAMRALCAATAGLEALEQHPHLSRRERQQAKAEPLAQFGLTVRWLIGIAKRNGTLDELMASVEASLEDE